MTKKQPVQTIILKMRMQAKQKKLKKLETLLSKLISKPIDLDVSLNLWVVKKKLDEIIKI